MIIMGYSGLGADVTVTQESHADATKAYQKTQRAWHGGLGRTTHAGFTCPAGSQPVCPPNNSCYCDDYNLVKRSGLAGTGLTNAGIATLLLAVGVLGGIGYISKKQREARFRNKLGLRGRR